MNIKVLGHDLFILGPEEPHRSEAATRPHAVGNFISMPEEQLGYKFNYTLKYRPHVQWSADANKGNIGA